jgi:aryl-alcohol dehydrogenase-like predicted oxidoreductase
MEKTVLGKTGLQVTKLGFGALELGGLTHLRPITDSEAERAVNSVLDAGINFIDTAVCYGLSEYYIGKYASHRRAEYVLSTKCGCVPCGIGESYHQGRHVWTQDTVMRNIDHSLRTMKTDYVDILQLHTPTVSETVENGLVEALQRIQTSGKARSIGISSTAPDIDEFLSWGVFSALQIPYSAFERAHESIITRAARAGAGTIIRGGVSSGEPGVGTGGRNERLRNMWTLWDKAKLDELLDDGESKTAFVLRFTLSHPDISTIIVGTKNPDHVRENARIAGKGSLAPAVLAEARKRLLDAGEAPLP